MRTRLVSILTVVSGLSMSQVAVLAQTPVGTAFTYQGLLKQSGAPINDTADFVLHLYDAETGGNQVGPVEAVYNVPVVDGLFTVELDFDDNAFNGDARWLEIAVRSPAGGGAYTTLSPRQPLNAAPYALYALNAPGGSSPWEITGSDIYYDAGNVGVGTSSPAYPLDVYSSGGTALHARNTSSTGGTALSAASDIGSAISASAFGSSGTTHGVSAEAHSPNGFAIYGINAAGTGNACALFGRSYSTSGRAVYGNASAASGLNYGVYGQSWSSSGRGVYGLASAASGINYGVYGQTDSPSGFAGYFVGGINYFEGDVGIGTAAPAAKLHIAGMAGTDGIMFPDGTLQITAATGAGGLWTPSGSNIYYDAGNVGIGTTSPTQRLHIVDPTPEETIALINSSGDDATGLRVDVTGASSAGIIVGATDVAIQGSSPFEGGTFYASGAGGRGLAGIASAATGDGKGVYGRSDSPDGYAGYFLGRGYFSDNVGIGEDSPMAKLHIGGIPDVDGIMFPDGTLQKTAATGGGGLWTPSGSNIYYDAGNVGIGWSGGAYPLDVRSSDNISVYARNTSSSGGTAIFATADGDGARGICVEAAAYSGTTYGVRSYSYSPDGFALWGTNEADDGTACGVYGESHSGDGIGVYGYVPYTQSSGSPIAVYGKMDQISGRAIYGEAAHASGTNYAVRGHTNSNNGYAGYFTGGRNYFEGNVGIGTSSPSERLDVVGVVKTTGFQLSTGAATGRVLTSDASGTATWQVPSSSPWTVTGPDVYYDAGNVGIGTSSPAKKLHVAGDTYIDGNVGIGTGPGTVAQLQLATDRLVGIQASTTFPVAGTAVWGNATADTGETRGVWGSASSPDGAGVYGSGVGVGVSGYSDNGIGVLGHHSATSGDAPGVYGKTSSETELAAGVKGEATATSGWFTIGVMGLSHSTGGIGVYGKADYASGATMGGYFVSESPNGKGVYGLATGTNSFAGFFDGRGHFSSDLNVEGTARVDVLQIDGGADLSENFAVDGGAEPGMVVVIDSDRPGALRTSSSAYDRRVAGIISGAGGIRTGMLMSQAGSVADGEHPVALTGRVYCWCDASSGAIEPGDLLTTSDTPGHAMKVSDHARAHGAVIGKAMTSLKESKGLVLVLVNLQ